MLTHNNIVKQLTFEIFNLIKKTQDLNLLKPYQNLKEIFNFQKNYYDLKYYPESIIKKEEDFHINN